ncbi:hypothetical protein [Leisingera methylohalidivorans]|uniref:Uncharacterized protein n=1 Tax=Leisingera methylohalidivorans DSM 14336 TaxID=999552 RepID=V9VQS1_9RHOB|nr:hypothetical protein [Leisingera methylohalidivorans]AHD01096.1 hypothetical protein METH_10740 [Leisingera methylohalidivorans DSM 14336]
MPHARVLIATILLTLPAAGLADVTGPGGKTIDCYCTDKSGSRVELGELRCLQVDGRMFMAQCQMSLNVPMWREVQSSCLSASLAPLPGASASPAELPHL